MNTLYKLYCRTFQLGFRIGTPMLPWRKPDILCDTDALSDKIKSEGIHRVLIVTDKGIRVLKLESGLLSSLDKFGISYEIYDETLSNPTIDNVESALALYKQTVCSGIVAIGGGSSIDCAKAVGACVVKSKKNIRQLRGLLRILKKLPFLAAIPTTAGTGSETTVAAVVVDAKTHEKFAVNDPCLIPRFAVLDPKLTVGLSKHMTAWTGIDALVHAVEAYIGGSNTRQSRQDALNAVSLIFNNLKKAYNDGTNLTARKNMQEAAFLGGAAFTRAYVGNIHAIAHTLGGMYGTQHGLANAVIMPYVLEDYGHKIDKSLSELSIAAGLGDDKKLDSENARIFMDAIIELNDYLNIPKTIPDLKESDIPLLVSRALKEANPLYPVPIIYDREHATRIYRKILVKED